jgi:hypothetical protein
VIKKTRRKLRRTLRPLLVPAGYTIALAVSLALFLGGMQSCGQETLPTNDRGVQIQVDNR